MAKTRSNTAPKKKALAKAKEKTPAKASKDRGKDSATTFKIKSSASAAIKPTHFHRPNRAEQSKIQYDKRPKSDAEREELKRKGSLYGWSLKAPGRPKKDNDDAEKEEAKDDNSPTVPISITSRVKQKKKPRGKYKSYDADEEVEAMNAAVEAYILAGDDRPFDAAVAAAKEINPTMLLKRTTLLYRVQKEKELRQKAASMDDHHFDRKSEGGDARGLTSKKEQEVLQSLAIARDNKNDGMGRKEMCQAVAQLKGVSLEKATNHYNYLIRSGNLKRLKRGGRVVKAQATTTNRTAVTSAKLLRTYMVLEEAFAEQRRLNGPDFTGELCDHFTANIDESSILASDGNLMVIANNNKSKQEKNTSDSRLSITTVRCGNAAGTDLARIYLAKGESLPHPTMKPGNFAKNHGAPEGSGVVMTPNAFMTNDAWIEIATLLSRGIRAADVIRDHPDWWVVLSLDGFGSHLCPEALEVFHNNKILVVKEEGDTSQVSQAYDQLVAKSDKRIIREYLDTYRTHVHGVLSQYDLILICNQALNDVPKKDWIESFDRVNMRPSTRKPFKDWVTKHEQQVKCADSLFVESDSFFEAMPALWQHMSEELRLEVFNLFKVFEEDGSDMWKQDNLLELIKVGISVDDIPKLRSCYLMAKEHPSVLKDPPPKPSSIDDDDVPKRKQTQLDRDYLGFVFSPEHVLTPYLKDKEKYGKLQEVSKLPPLTKDDITLESVQTLKLSAAIVGQATTCWPKDRSREIAGDLYKHMCNFTAASWGYNNDGPLLPSPYLDAHIDRDQAKLLNPTPRDVQLGALIAQCSGEQAVKKIAKRRLDIMSGNINSYARVLNGEAQMGQIKNFTDLSASIAEMNREKAKRDAQKQEEKKKTEAEKAEKKRQQKLKEQEDHDRLLPGCKEDVEERGKVFVLNCTVARKKEILKHYFGYTAPLYKMAKAGVDQLIEDYFSKMEVAATDALAAYATANATADVTADATGGNVAVDKALIDADATGDNAVVNEAAAAHPTMDNVDVDNVDVVDEALADADATSDNAIVDEDAIVDHVAVNEQTATAAEGMDESALTADANENAGMRRTGRKRKLSQKASAAEKS